jgi:hypothetical protein
MDQKKKNLQEMRKLGFSQKTLSLMTESQIDMILEKIKKKESKEAVQTTTYKTTDSNDAAALNNMSPDEKGKLTFNTDGTATKKTETKEAITKTVYQPRKNPADAKAIQDMITKTNPNVSVELDEGKKKKKKYNPWAVCTASVGRKNKKKYEDCVMGVKKKLKEGRNPYEYLIESKMEEIVENNLSPKMSKGELLRIIAEKKMMMKKPIGKMISMKGETMEGDTKTAPAPTRTTPKTEPGTRPSHPGRKSKEQPNPKPKAKKQASDSEMESKKSEIITAIFNLIDKVN